MEIKIRNKNGIILQTKNKICDDNIVIKLDNSLIPSGNIDIINTEEVDVTQYTKAQIKDENLKAENIAENVEVLGITGTFRGGVDTSDGTITADKVLKDEVGYAKEERIVGTIETYDYSTSEEVSPEIDKFLQGEVTELYNDRVTKIIANRCEMDLRLTKVDLPNVATVGNEAFKDCSKITSVNLPKVTSIGDSAFLDCYKLNEVHIPLVTYIGGSAFSNCPLLTNLNIPLVTALGGNAIDRTGIKTISVPSMTTVTSKAFAMNVRTTKNNLKTIYIPNAKSCQSYAFYGACGTTAIIITQTEKVCTLPEAIANAFKYAWHYLGTVDSYNNPDGLKDGYIYVDASMVDQYKQATNWSALASQFKTLEEIPQEIKEELGL